MRGDDWKEKKKDIHTIKRNEWVDTSSLTYKVVPASRKRTHTDTSSHQNKVNQNKNKKERDRKGWVKKKKGHDTGGSFGLIGSRGIGEEVRYTIWFSHIVKHGEIRRRGDGVNYTQYAKLLRFLFFVFDCIDILVNDQQWTWKSVVAFCSTKRKPSRWYFNRISRCSLRIRTWYFSFLMR